METKLPSNNLFLDFSKYNKNCNIMTLFTSAPIHPDTRRVLETPQAPSISSVVDPSSWGLLGVASPRLTWLREAANSSTAAGNKHVTT